MATKTKIFYIHCGGNTIGGVETYLSHMVENHKNNEAYLGIVKSGNFLHYLREQQTKNIIHLHGGRLRELNKVGIAIRNACRFVRRNKIKLIIAKGYNSWIYGSIVAYLTKTKSIFYIANDINPQYWKSPITCIGSYLRPNHYLANSQFTAVSIKEILNKKASIVYPAANISKFTNIDHNQARNFLCKEFAIAPHKFIYTIVGRLQEWKGQHIAISAFKEMHNKKNSVLLVVGDYTHESDRPFFERLQQLATNENVIFTGFRKDVPQIVSGSDVIIHASTTPEPFGITIIEGMFARKPVIASAAGGPLEIIEHNKSGLLVLPKNPNKLAKSMDKLHNNQKQCILLGKKAYEEAQKKFSIEASIHRMEEVIDSIL
ncbi:glycosyltransferase family 4 protein [Candidatus Uabimicrobium sp. HlEnr_7]|uniref:glycosyltransferase family 4 protein n=1 Tax=Candidatus Uabimicrobium helgolandensis TaxID=3095367 RepID=UPI0035592063